MLQSQQRLFSSFMMANSIHQINQQTHLCSQESVCLFSPHLFLFSEHTAITELFSRRTSTSSSVLPNLPSTELMQVVARYQCLHKKELTFHIASGLKKQKKYREIQRIEKALNVHKDLSARTVIYFKNILPNEMQKRYLFHLVAILDMWRISTGFCITHTFMF